jgi:hypothetical protein
MADDTWNTRVPAWPNPVVIPPPGPGVAIDPALILATNEIDSLQMENFLIAHDALECSRGVMRDEGSRHEFVLR